MLLLENGCIYIYYLAGVMLKLIRELYFLSLLTSCLFICCCDR